MTETVRPRRARARRILAPAFFARPTLGVAADLIGMVLAHDVRGRRTAGMIVEVEAYIGESDPACHAAPGPTKRNAPLYGPPGRAYVYLNYGMHYLVNAVTEPEGHPAAILIRALEPLEGIDLMRARRRRARSRRGVRTNPDHPAAVDLCRGPGNLTIALGIGPRQNGIALATSALTIEDHGFRPGPLQWSSRIGIAVGVDRPWRCAVAGHPCVSGVVSVAGAPAGPRRRVPRS